MIRPPITLRSKTARALAASYVMDAAPDGCVVSFKEPTRSLEQNALMWARLDQISREVEWYGQKLMPTEWKHIFTASLKKQKVIPGLDGEFVVLPAGTSTMGKSELSNLLALMEAFAAERGVTFRDQVEALEHCR